jgi:shikimate kinase
MLQALNPGAVSRPNLQDAASAQARFTARHPLYRRLARATIDTADLTPEEAVPALLSRLGTLG